MEVPRDTRENVEEDYRYSAVDAMLDLVLKGEMTVDEVADNYKQEFTEK